MVAQRFLVPLVGVRVPAGLPPIPKTPSVTFNYQTVDQKD